MSSLRSALWIPLRFILLILLSPTVTIVYWALVLILGVPSHFFRKIVSFVARQHDGDLGNLVTPKGTISGRDFADWTTNPSQAITVVLKIKGKCDISTLQKHILRTWVHKRDGEKCLLQYPELQQYCTLRLGYLFFKWDRKFDISNHVKLYKSEEIEEETVVNDEKLHSIWEKVTTRGYNPKTSPWELFLIENYDPHGKVCSVEELEGIPDEERHCVWIFRGHHCIFDGFSIYRLLILLTDQALPLWEKEAACKIPKYYNFLMNLKALVFGPTAYTKAALQGVDYLHGLHYSHDRLLGKYIIVTSTLDIKLVKSASNLHKVSFHAVLIGAVSGGIRKYLLKNNLTLPLQPIRLGMPISQPNHTTKLRNEWLSGMVPLPVHKKTASQRLIAAEQELKRLKSGALIPVLTQTITLIGGFPVSAVRLLTNKASSSLMYSEMRAPNVQLTFFEKRLSLTDIMYSFGLGTDDLGVVFSSLSYNGKINLILTLDRGIFNTKEKADDFMQCVVSDIEELLSLN